MFNFVGGEVWKKVNALARKSSVKKAAIAYISTDAVIQFNKGDLLFVDASDQAVSSGQTSAAVIRRAFDRKASIYSCPGLHAKVMLFNGMAIIGSANISESSKNDLIEAAIVTDVPGIVASVTAFFESLKHVSDRVDNTFVERIEKIPVVRKGGRGSKKRANIRSRYSEPRVWLIGTQDMDDNEYPDEVDRINRGLELAKKDRAKNSSDVTWLRFTGNSTFRKEAKRRDLIINICRDKGEKTPYGVYRHFPILRRQEEPNCTRFYVELFSNAKKTKLSWRAFKQLVKQVGLPGKVGPKSVRLISCAHSDALFALWNEAR